MPMDAHPGMHAISATPTVPGQDTFAAIQEIVQILDADPKTDWSKVDLETPRQHLIDMSEVTLKAAAAPNPIDGGLEIAGTGRTLVAIQRMSRIGSDQVRGVRFEGERMVLIPPPRRAGESEEHREITWERIAAE